jgi:hypothetical protein
MEINFSQLNKEDKLRVYASAIMIISFIFPWWKISSNLSINAFSNSGAFSYNGFQMYAYPVGLLSAIAALYFIFTNQKYSLWCAIVAVLYSVNTYFGLVGSLNTNFNMSFGGLGDMSVKDGYSFGYYIYVMASFLSLYIELKRVGLFQSDNKPHESKEENTNQ